MIEARSVEHVKIAELRLLDYGASDAIAGVAGRITPVIVGIRMNHDGRPIGIEQGPVAAAERHVRGQNIDTQDTITANELIGQIASVRPAFCHVAVLLSAWRKMATCRFEF